MPESDLARMFRNIDKLKKTKDGKVFIDRNAKQFEQVLDYLRNDLEITPFEDKFQQGQFVKELNYWKLKGKTKASRAENKAIRKLDFSSHEVSNSDQNP